MHSRYSKWLVAGASVATLVSGIGAAAHFAAPAQAAPSVIGQSSDRVADVAEAVVDSVVNISSTRQVEMGPYANDPMFTDPRSPFYQAPDDRKAQSLGSGVIITAQGRILTNAHVVNGADAIKVVLADGTEHDAKLVGADPRADLAVLQLEGRVPALKPIALGDSSKLRLGETVLAIGNPFGVGQAVTMGIVSAKGRANMGIVDYEDFIQTDAAINPGNSGGALVNLRGELVGINTAILSRSGGSQGIGFAIPTDMARPIMDMLVKDGKVSRGFLGVNMTTLTRAIATEQNLSAVQGVLITNVVAGGPGAKGGLRPGDVVVAVDGANVSDAGHFKNKVGMKGSGKALDLTVVRGKGREQVRITLGEFPEQAQTRPVNVRRRR